MRLGFIQEGFLEEEECNLHFVSAVWEGHILREKSQKQQTKPGWGMVETFWGEVATAGWILIWGVLHMAAFLQNREDAADE